MLLGKGSGYWSAQATLCNLVQSGRLQGKKAIQGSLTTSPNTDCCCLPIHVLQLLVSTKNTPPPLDQIECIREKFLGTISLVFVDIQRWRRRSTPLPAQLSLLRRGRGENRKPFSKDFNQSNCIFRFDDNSLGCESMFELFWI